MKFLTALIKAILIICVAIVLLNLVAVLVIAKFSYF